MHNSAMADISRTHRGEADTCPLERLLATSWDWRLPSSPGLLSLFSCPGCGRPKHSVAVRRPDGVSPYLVARPAWQEPRKPVTSRARPPGRNKSNGSAEQDVDGASARADDRAAGACVGRARCQGARDA